MQSIIGIKTAVKLHHHECVLSLELVLSLGLTLTLQYWDTQHIPQSNGERFCVLTTIGQQELLLLRQNGVSFIQIQPYCNSNIISSFKFRGSWRRTQVLWFLFLCGNWIAEAGSEVQCYWTWEQFQQLFVWAELFSDIFSVSIKTWFNGNNSVKSKKYIIQSWKHF